jgi:hypothetical protein
MESAIKEVLLQNDSFEIMQRAFGNELECQGKYPTKYLNQLKVIYIFIFFSTKWYL